MGLIIKRSYWRTDTGESEFKVNIDNCDSKEEFAEIVKEEKEALDKFLTEDDEYVYTRLYPIEDTECKYLYHLYSENDWRQDMSFFYLEDTYGAELYKFYDPSYQGEDIPNEILYQIEEISEMNDQECENIEKELNQ